MLLARLGYSVVAVSGKVDRYDWLRELGASDIVGRDAVLHDGQRPLLKTRWAGAVDTVGGSMLASLLSSIENEGCVAACGVVGGAAVNTSVYPFILRGVTLRGIDSAWCPLSRRREVWDLLAGAWELPSLRAISNVVELAEVTDVVDEVMAGTHVGRTVLDVRR
jgi:putative YhdH/YhfP family quinone oxidoreductase